MESNPRVIFNWGAFNIPTILAIASVGWFTATKQERQDARLDNIEIARDARSIEVNRVMEALQMKTNPIDNIVYRLTVAESGLVETNRRIDRVGDSFQGIRDDVAGLSTKFEVLSQKIDAAVSQRAASNGMPSRPSLK